MVHEKVYMSQDEILMEFLRSINFGAWTAAQVHAFVVQYEASDEDAQYWTRGQREKIAFRGECDELRYKLNRIEERLAKEKAAREAKDREQGLDEPEGPDTSIIPARVAVPRKNADGIVEFVHELPFNLSCDEMIDQVEGLCEDADLIITKIKSLDFTARHAFHKKDKKRYGDHFEDHATFQRIMAWGR